MTTKVHIVNFGPSAVEVEVTHDVLKHELYSQQSMDVLVYDG